MKPIASHLILRTQDGRPLAPGPTERRKFASVVGRYAEEFDIFGFDNPREHGHVGAACAGSAVGRLSRNLKNALSWSLDLPCSFLRIEPRPITERNHLLRTFHYILAQAERHGVDDDPLREASMLPDILGYRVLLPAKRVLVKVLGPKALDRRELLRNLGSLELRPGTDLRHLPDAAASAVGADWSGGRHPRLVAARRAAVGIGYQLNATTAQIAVLLDLSRTRVRALRAGEADDADLARAIRLQIGLREQAGIRPTRL